MSRRGRRERAKARFEPGVTFAAIPVEVLTSEAYASLPDYAVRVMVALAAQYRGRNNGDLSLTQPMAAAHGVRQAWKVQAGLQLLTQTGLAVRTRQGRYEHGKGICALYAIAWKQIDPTPEAYPPILMARNPPNDWTRWTAPSNWKQTEKDVRRKAQGASGVGFSSIKSSGSVSIKSSVSKMLPEPLPDQGVLIGHARVPSPIQSSRLCDLPESPRRGGDSCVSEGVSVPSKRARTPATTTPSEVARQKVEKLRSQLPDFPIGDIAKVVSLPVETVRAILNGAV